MVDGIYQIAGNPPRRVVLQLTAKKAVKRGDRWLSDMIVHCFFQENRRSPSRPFSDCPLVLLVDGRDVSRETGLLEILTNPQGIFQHAIALPGLGSYQIGVKIRDTGILALEWVDVVEERQPQRPLPKLSVESLGFKPKLRFIIHLTDHESRGTAGKVEVSTYADPGLFEIIEVDSSGSVIWPPRDKTAIKFRDKRRTYRFRIVGADLKDKERTCECVVS